MSFFRNNIFTISFIEELNANLYGQLAKKMQSGRT